MNNYRIFSFLVIAFALMMTACRKDEVVTNTTVIPPTPEVIVVASLYGQVVDETGAALEGVSITLKNNVYTTDENGYFDFTNVQMNEYGTYVKAEKDGYYLGAKVIEPSVGNRSYLKIMLLEKELTGTVEAASGGTISTNGGATVNLPANGIRVDGGSAYSGTVNVFAKWIDPTGANILETMPGDLRASNTEGEFVQLETFGMIAVELESPTGEPLNLAEGQRATLEMPVPSEIIGNAPSTIPLWSFDEETGFWREEGTATLQGDKYVGEVGHFSFWNCDVPYPLIQLTGNIINEGGNAIGSHSIKILVNSNGICRYGYTDTEGNFSGKVPKDEELTIEVMDNCGNVIYSAVVGPFSDDTTLPTITVTSNQYLFDLTGALVDCDGNAVVDGYAKVTIGEFNLLVPVDETGSFNFTFSNCDAATELEVIAYDLVAFKESATSTYDITGLSSLDLGNINICDDLSEYLNITVDGVSTTIVDPMARTNINLNPGIIIDGYGLDSTIVNIVIFDEDSPGTYNPDNMWVTMTPDGGISYVTIACEATICDDMEVNITTVESVGGVIIGDFNGTLPDLSGQGTYEVEGDFKIIIDQ